MATASIPVSITSRAVSCLHLDRLTVSSEGRLTSAGGRSGAPVGHLGRRVRRRAAVHLGVAEVDVAADRVGYHRGYGVIVGLKHFGRFCEYLECS